MKSENLDKVVAKIKGILNLHKFDKLEGFYIRARLFEELTKDFDKTESTQFKIMAEMTKKVIDK